MAHAAIVLDDEPPVNVVRHGSPSSVTTIGRIPGFIISPRERRPRHSLGPYEVLSSLGAGGMGEVYRARDTTLGREVALKILPDRVAGDGDRVARFRREAQILASLNHPLIAAIYGVEDSGATPVLVLELVDGMTLAERIGAGRLPIDEALPIAQQIAQALAVAHERGIVHRDPLSRIRSPGCSLPGV